MVGNITKGHILETDDEGKWAKIEAWGEVMKNVLIVSHTGISYNPLPGETSQCVMLYPNNHKGHRMTIPYNVPDRPPVKPGEIAMYSEVGRNQLTMKKNGDIEITGTKDFLAETLQNLTVNASANVTLNANNVDIDGSNVTIDGSSSVDVGGATINISGSATVNINAPAVNLGDATANVLTENAQMIANLSTGIVTITSPGQTKVKA